MRELAESIARLSPDVELGVVDWLSFEDGFPKLMIREVEAIRRRRVAFLACFDTPGALLEQLGVIFELPRYGAGDFRVVLPYFPTGTMERVRREGEIATANTLARVLSLTPLSAMGPSEIVIFDIHALQERFYFRDNVIPRLETAIPLLEARLEELSDTSQLSIAFPDEGAWKRFEHLLQDYPQIVCHKVREGDRRVVTVKEGDPRGRHVVIVDDLVQTGGTLLECRRVLAEKGAGAVSAFVTHGVFPKESWKRFKAEEYDHFWITDSCPASAKAVAGRRPFEVLSLGPAIARVITR
jgi:ribose-phosphate pyrophosphokinase